VSVLVVYSNASGDDQIKALVNGILTVTRKVIQSLVSAVGAALENKLNARRPCHDRRALGSFVAC
jgi:hypothetical protein